VREFNRGIVAPDSPEMAAIEERCRRNLEDSVSDPVLREKLRPNYRAACKRLIMSPDYYLHAQRANVCIEIGAIESIEPHGLRMRDGTLHLLDILVLATGFQADRFVRPIEVTGEDALALNEVWAVRPVAYLAVSVPGFPNFFLLNGPSGPVGNFSLIDVAEREWAYIDQLLEPVRAGEFAGVAASPQALADYELRRIAAARTTIWASGCKSWYLDSQGIPTSWPWPYDRFAAELTTPRRADFVYR
jgi:cation diffusion facilitator CzcD-associated flavoprotein CzcO